MPKIIIDLPESISTAIEQLKTNATIVVTLAMEGDDTNQFTAVYVPETSYLPNRISYPAVFSPFNAPDGTFLVQAEIIIENLNALSHVSDDELVKHVLDGLRKFKLVPDGTRYLRSWIDRYELAYVVYTQGYERHLNAIVEWGRENGIYFHGRFGSHNYLNVDGCLQQSIELAGELGYHNTEEVVRAIFSQRRLNHNA